MRFFTTDSLNGLYRVYTDDNGIIWCQRFVRGTKGNLLYSTAWEKIEKIPSHWEEVL